MKFFREKKDRKMIANLLSTEGKEKQLEKLTVLQNEISVAYNNKVIAITSIEQNALAAAFAKAFADTFVHNGSSALLIDANLYDVCLGQMLSIPCQKVSGLGEAKLDIAKLGDKLGVLCLGKETYPAEAYKSGIIQNLIEENEKNYEHIIVLMPSVKAHKELALMKGILDSILLIVRRDVTKKSEIFYSLQYFCSAELPVSKTVILK